MALCNSRLALSGHCVIGLLAMLLPALAQKPEIYLGPMGDDPLPPPATTHLENHLAKCLKNPDDLVSCAVAGSAATDGGLESAMPGQIAPSAYVSCADPGGVCLEVATLDLAAGDAARVPPERFASVAVTIAFDYDSAAIRVSEERKLAQLATALLHPDNQGTRFAIIGHTDTKGTAAYNCGLSRRRAEAVAARLAALDVPSARLLMLGVGFHVPHNRADGLSPENRRVGFAPIADDDDPVLRKLRALCQG